MNTIQSIISTLSSMSMATILGYIAATMTTLSFGVGAVDTIRTRNVSGVSIGMSLTYFFGVIMWIIYGIMLQAWPMIISQVITLSFSTVILIIKLIDMGKKRYL